MRPHGEPGDPRRRGPAPGPSPDGGAAAAYRAPTPPPAGPGGRHGRPNESVPGRPAPTTPVPSGRPSSGDGDGDGDGDRANGAVRSASPTSGGGDATPDTILAGAGGYASRPPRAAREATGGDSGETTAVGSGGRHRRGGAGTGPGREDGGRRAGARGRKGKKKGSFWRELPLLIVVAVVLTFVIQTFLGRIYVIPSASMERTLHGCSGCANDRVAVDKLTYRFTEPAPGDVVVFRGPPSWADNDEVAPERSGNVLVRGLQDAGSLVGLAPPDEQDFVKRVIAVGGQRVQCCDAQNRVLVDGRPLAEPYLFFQDGFGDRQEPFDPVTVPAGQLWVMGDNRNNSADARVHGPIGVGDVIGKARAIVLPVGRWGGVPDTDPQAAAGALGAPPPAVPGLPPGPAVPVPVPAPLAALPAGRPGS